MFSIMYRPFTPRFFWLIILMFTVYTTIAQEETCPELVVSALEITEESCNETARNQVCYGHFSLDAAPYIETDEFDFNSPGDLENIAALRSLRLSAMNEALGAWGVALMAVAATQATGQAEDVTFVMFGDVELNNPVTIMSVITQEVTNIRQKPGTNNPIVGSVDASVSLTANGRLPDSSWIRVRLSEEENSIGWIFADLISSQGNLNSLNIIDPDTQDTLSTNLAYGPMQVFTIETGAQDAPCAEAPNSGMMIQTPEGAAEVTLLMNEIDISLRATAFVQAQAEGNLELFVLDGTATVTSDGVDYTVIPGSSITIPLDAFGMASGPPDAPQPFDSSQLQNIPVTLLPQQIEIPPPLNVPAGFPVNGQWSFSWSINSATCPNGQTIEFTSNATTSTLTVAEDGSGFNLLLTPYNRTEDGTFTAVYTDASANLHRHTLTALSFDRFSGQAEIDFIQYGCTVTVPFILRLVEPS